MLIQQQQRRPNKLFKIRNIIIIYKKCILIIEKKTYKLIF
jgi:hypothetical protein